MCDTLCALPENTAQRVTLFAKNSDRQRNEAQGIEFHSRATHSPDTRLACTYIAIPQARQTYSVLLSRPYWIWGAEMGANEHGVVAGNETVYAKSPPPEGPALIGMDLVRLALERSATAAEALEVMTTLLERHGQGGDCGHMTHFYYNNSFLVADPTEAFVLETLGREWIVERVKGLRTISNCYSIGSGESRTSARLKELMREAGWSVGDSIHYADAIADREKERLAESRERRMRSTHLLTSEKRQLRLSHMMNALRDHGPTETTEWNPSADLPRGLCIHARGDLRVSQTTASMVSEIHQDRAVHWLTGTAAPCISIFKPVLMDVQLPPLGPSPTGTYEARTLWWRHEQLHRAALMGDFPKFLASIRTERDALEARFQAAVAAVLDGGDALDRARVISECWKEAIATEERWFGQLTPASVHEDIKYRAAWLRMSRVASMDCVSLNQQADSLSDKVFQQIQSSIPQ